jgi:DNA-binding CsgD family transcriptional regulator
MGRLLERGRERAVIGGLIDACVGGDGRVLLVEGPAGIGKTALVDEACARAQVAGMTVLTARSDELEQQFGYAVVRQLFESFVREAGADERRALLAGAAGLAAPVVAPDAAADGLIGGERTFAVLHGLYWLTVNLAGRGPLLIVVDDAQWCDAPSLRFLIYLARRLEALGVLIVVGVRAGEPDAEVGLMEKLSSEPITSVLKPAPLTVAAVHELLRSGPQDPDEGFVVSCHRATAGNPFLLGELIGTLARDRVPATPAAAAQVGEMGLDTVARAVVARLARLPPSAGALARAVSVLGDRSEPRFAAALAGLDERTAAEALDSLVAVELLMPEPPLDFAHPIVRASIYEDLGPAARSQAHRRAAQLLGAERADPERVATHLLASEPAGDPETVHWLRAAAGAALGHGAPEAAVTYLRRARREPPPAPDRAIVLHELGTAEAAVGDPGAVTDLEEAFRCSRDPARRARIAHDLVETLIVGGRWDDGVALIDTTLAELGEDESELAMRMEWMRAAGIAYDSRRADGLTDDLPRLRALVERGGRASRGLALLLAALSAMHTGDAADVVRLVEIGLDGGRFLADEGSEALALGQVFGALVYVDELDRAHDLAEAVLDDARRRGSLMGLVIGLTYRGLVFGQRGAMRSAEADLLGVLSLARDNDALFAVPTILRYLADTLLERPGLHEVREFVEAIDLDAAFMATYSGALLVDVRARLRLAAGDRAAGIDGLRHCNALHDALGVRNPVPFATRSALALALALEPDGRAEASVLVAEELEMARATGLPRAEGIALRAAGMVEGGQRGIQLLADAVEILGRCPSELEQARGLVELGSALRRAGRRREAREPLRQGLDLAGRCGASRLATRAEEELRAAGAKPRRLAFSGLDALTPSERRVAELAAREMSNQQIAQAVVVTAKTVENHLGRVYQKLGIHSRGELEDALSVPAAFAPGSEQV